MYHKSHTHARAVHAQPTPATYATASMAWPRRNQMSFLTKSNPMGSPTYGVPNTSFQHLVARGFCKPQPHHLQRSGARCLRLLVIHSTKLRQRQLSVRTHTQTQAGKQQLPFLAHNHCWPNVQLAPTSTDAICTPGTGHKQIRPRAGSETFSLNLTRLPLKMANRLLRNYVAQLSYTRAGDPNCPIIIQIQIQASGAAHHHRGSCADHTWAGRRLDPIQSCDFLMLDRSRELKKAAEALVRSSRGAGKEGERGREAGKEGERGREEDEKSGVGEVGVEVLSPGTEIGLVGERRSEISASAEFLRLAPFSRTARWIRSTWSSMLASGSTDTEMG